MSLFTLQSTGQALEECQGSGPERGPAEVTHHLNGGREGHTTSAGVPALRLGEKIQKC